MNEITLNTIGAIVAGISGGAVAVALTIVMLAVAPKRFPLHPLYLVGSIFSIETTSALLNGLLVILSISGAYGIVIAALFVGFETSSFLPLWGGLAGAALSILTGTSVAYLRVVNPAIRKGLVGDPGPFVIRYGGWQVAAVVLSHVIFGLVTGAVYAVLK